jgi:hypothetical protein
LRVHRRHYHTYILPDTATRSRTEPPADDVTQHVYDVRAPNTPNQLQHKHLEHSQGHNTLSATLTTSNAQSTTSPAETGTANSSQSSDDGRPRQIIRRRGPIPTRYCSWFQSSCAKPHKYFQHFANHYRDKHLLGHWDLANNAFCCCNTVFPADGTKLIKHVWKVHLALPHRSVTIAE